MALSPFVSWSLRFGTLALVVGCGYSQEEWDQKVRETEAMRGKLGAQEVARRKCETDYADALHEADELRAQLKARGADLSHPGADIERHKRAVDEYTQRLRQVDDAKRRLELLKTRLLPLTEQGVTTTVRDGQIVLQIAGDMLFEAQGTALRKEGQGLLRQLAEVLRSEPALAQREFQATGHTDGKPVKAGAFIDSWGLSSMRARSVVAFLTEPTASGGCGLSPLHWSAAGFADTDPIAAVDTDENRGKNRRVELVMLPSADERLFVGTPAP